MQYSDVWYIPPDEHGVYHVLILDECNLPITDDRISILEEVVRYRDAHQHPTLFTTNWDLSTFQEKWGMQIGDVVAKAQWIDISKLKLRKTVEGAVESF
jgi:hypothetical protein